MARDRLGQLPDEAFDNDITDLNSDKAYSPEHRNWRDRLLSRIADKQAEVRKAYNPSQPRVGSGSREGGRWRPVHGGNSAIQNMRSFLQMTESAGDKGATWFLENGRPYPTDAESFIGGKPHMCYMNTLHAVLDDPTLTYVEGYVSVHGVPIHHAWAVDTNGVVRDYTLKDNKGILGYYGVPLKSSYVMDAAMRTKVYGVTAGRNMAQVIEDGKAGVLGP